MYYTNTMQATFEAEKNRKAFIYTVIICATLLLLAFIIRFRIDKVIPPLPLDLIEVNLGNNEEGFGEVQPLKRGDMSQAQIPVPQPKQTASADEATSKPIEPDDNADDDAAPVKKPEKTNPKATTVKENTAKTVKSTTTADVPAPPAPKPQKPKYAYNGPGTGNGNNADQDNGYQYQGNKPGGKGDAGDPSGHPDSYGNNPGGKVGGPKVFGNRKIVKYYSFTGELDKATIYAIVKVSPDGTGTFAGFDKRSTSRSAAYSNAIIQYLKNIQFDKAADESTVVVQFNFNIQ
jgi:hypothetical protein